MAAVDEAPAPQRHAPHRWQLGEQAEARAYVFGALGVVSRAAEKRRRPAFRPLLARRVEALERDAEMRWMAADLVQSDQPVVAVERGVLDPLRHDRRRELLEAHREAQHVFPSRTFGRR